MTVALQPYLEPGWFVDSDHPAIVALADEIGQGVPDQVERACRLYYAVRDGIRYTAYHLDLSRSALRASAVLASGASWCVPKSVLLAALCRASGIACRLGYANVCNHLATKKLLDFLGTNIFYYHGYNEIFLNGKWVKATVAFNRTLCDKARLAPLEFDGQHDSIYHPYDLTGQRHMEYLHDYGGFADVPYEALLTKFAAEYPRADGQPWVRTALSGDFEAEIEAEAAEN
jgi:transglutaminase-like putative cysteine protease